MKQNVPDFIYFGFSFKIKPDLTVFLLLFNFFTGRLMHLYAICVDCLEGVHKIVCIKCKSRWDGSWHQLGTMYTYDILAASPCCQVDTWALKWGWVTMTTFLYIKL